MPVRVFRLESFLAKMNGPDFVSHISQKRKFLKKSKRICNLIHNQVMSSSEEGYDYSEGGWEDDDDDEDAILGQCLQFAHETHVAMWVSLLVSEVSVKD